MNVDTLILADFAARLRPSAQRVVDLGAGVGALSIAFAHLGRARRCDLVERAPALAALAQLNLIAASIEGTVHVADLAGQGLPTSLRGKADVVVSNPPFFDGASRGGEAVRADDSRRAGRSGPLEPFLQAATLAMGRRAHAFFAYPASALPELLSKARAAGLVPKRLRLVHAFARSEARIALVELRRAKPGGLVVEPPCIEWTASKVRSPELEALVQGESRRSSADPE